jgi:glycosyltransferase involved in cell wall biosynthesis
MPGRLHILVIPAWYPSPENPVAGIFVRDLARAVAIGNDVTVLAPTSSIAPPDNYEKGVRTLRLPPTRGIGRPARGYSQFHAISRAVSRLRKEGRPPDVVHAHVFAAGFFAVLVGRRWRLPVVVSEHHSDVVEGRLVGLDARVARSAYRYADLVCPVSPLLERSLLALEPRARCQVVPNVVDIDAFSLPRPAAGPTPRRHVLAVSSLSGYKGLRYLLDAIRLLAAERPGLTLTIIGEGPERATLESLAAGLPVAFLGTRSRAEIAARMSEADVFAMPSLVETFGIAAVEALAARLPVVVTSNCGVAELVAAHGGTVVPPADSGALRDALAVLLDRSDNLPPSATADLRGTYGHEAIRRRWLSIYDSLLRARR